MKIIYLLFLIFSSLTFAQSQKDKGKTLETEYIKTIETCTTVDGSVECKKEEERQRLKEPYIDSDDDLDFFDELDDEINEESNK